MENIVIYICAEHRSVYIIQQTTGLYTIIAYPNTSVVTRKTHRRQHNAPPAPPGLPHARPSTFQSPITPNPTPAATAPTSMTHGAAVGTAGLLVPTTNCPPC